MKNSNSDEVKLPTEYLEPGGKLNDFAILIHGEKKIGKTTLANQGGRVLFLQFDPPQRSLKRLEIVCPDWKTFKKVINKLKARVDSGKEIGYDRIVLDRADLCYKACEEYVMQKLGIEKMSDEPYGGAWTLVDRLFSQTMRDFLNFPCGRWFLCHSTRETVEDRHGEEIEKLVPNLSKRADSCLNGTCDAWFAYIYEGGERKLVIKGDERIGAGHRMDRNFRTKEGNHIKSLTMPSTPEGSYKQLLSAFNNEFSLEEKPKSKVKIKKS